MSIGGGIKAYWNLFGVRGLAVIAAYRLFQWPKEIVARPQGILQPVHLRVRTSDISTLGDILLGAEYACELPFSPQTILDVGANIGMASIYFAHKYPRANVIALEPESSNFAMLKKNVSAYPAIRPIQAALWNRDGEVGIGQPDRSCESRDKVGFVTREMLGAPVRAVTMPTLMRELGIVSIDVLKIDIEGAEKEVFESCGWLADVGCVMIELHDRFKPGCTEAVDSATAGFSKSDRGETRFYIRQHWRELSAVAPLTE